MTVTNVTVFIIPQATTYVLRWCRCRVKHRLSIAANELCEQRGRRRPTRTKQRAIFPFENMNKREVCWADLALPFLVAIVCQEPKVNKAFNVPLRNSLVSSYQLHVNNV